MNDHSMERMAQVKFASCVVTRFLSHHLSVAEHGVVAMTLIFLPACAYGSKLQAMLTLLPAALPALSQ